LQFEQVSYVELCSDSGPRNVGSILQTQSRLWCPAWAEWTNHFKWL